MTVTLINLFTLSGIALIRPTAIPINTYQFWPTDEIARYLISTSSKYSIFQPIKKNTLDTETLAGNKFHIIGFLGELTVTIFNSDNWV